jgi:TetR/AcrR family transcriptional repressor of bet genes
MGVALEAFIVPRPPNTDQRREEIVDGLLEVMATRGLKGASTAAIAEAAGLTPGLVHYHFKTKAAVLESAVDRLLADHRKRVVRALAGARQPVERVDAWIDATADRDHADPRAVACWVALAGEATSDRTVRTALRRALRVMLDDLGPLLEAALPDQPADERETLADGMLALVLGAFLLGATAPEAVMPGFLTHQLRALVFAAGIGAEELP